MCGHQSGPVKQYFLCQCFLGDYSKGLLVDEEAEEAIARFQEKLQEISETIKTRNRALEWPYIHLLPERVPNSVMFDKLRDTLPLLKTPPVVCNCCSVTCVLI